MGQDPYMHITAFIFAISGMFILTAKDEYERIVPGVMYSYVLWLVVDVLFTLILTGNLAITFDRINSFMPVPVYTSFWGCLLLFFIILAAVFPKMEEFSRIQGIKINVLDKLVASKSFSRIGLVLLIFNVLFFAGSCYALAVPKILPDLSKASQLLICAVIILVPYFTVSWLLKLVHISITEDEKALSCYTTSIGYCAQKALESMLEKDEKKAAEYIEQIITYTNKDNFV